MRPTSSKLNNRRWSSFLVLYSWMNWALGLRTEGWEVPEDVAGVIGLVEGAVDPLSSMEDLAGFICFPELLLCLSVLVEFSIFSFMLSFVKPRG